MLEKVATRTAHLTLAHILAMGGNAAAHLLLAIWLDPQIYGSLFFFMTVLNFMLMGAALGFPHVLMHQAPRMAQRGDETALSALVYDSWSVGALAGFLIAAALAAVHFFIYPLPMPQADAAVLWLLVIAPLWSLIRMMLAFLQSRGATYAGVLPDQGAQAAGLLLMPVLAFAGLGALDHLGFLLAGQVIAGAVAIIVAYLAVRHYFPAMAAYRFHIVKPLRQWFSLAAPFFSFNLLQIAVQRLDMLMLGILAGPRELAVYAVAVKISQLLNFPAMGSKAALAPRFSELYERGDRPAMFKLLGQSTLVIGGAGLALGAALYLFAPYAFSLMGSIYESKGQQLLIMLLAAEVLVCILTPVKLKALMGDKQKTLSFIFAAGLTVSIAANLYYIPIYGALAAAVIRLVVMTIVHLGIAALFLSGGRARRTV